LTGRVLGGIEMVCDESLTRSVVGGRLSANGGTGCVEGKPGEWHGTPLCNMVCVGDLKVFRGERIGFCSYGGGTFRTGAGGFWWNSGTGWNGGWNGVGACVYIIILISYIYI
jgi:hypothetical protein